MALAQASGFGHALASLVSLVFVLLAPAASCGLAWLVGRLFDVAGDPVSPTTKV